jgi:cell division protein FtsI (penicillin-binding protein 3)
MLSSNIGTARMAFAAGGADPERAFLEKVHLMARPELEIAELAKPQLPRRWVDITTATVAFGHGLAVAPISFVEAAAGIVNDGMRAPPTLLKRDPAVPIQLERLVSEKTAKDLQLLMWLTVQKGTGTHAQVPGYLVGGKTGTADRADPVHGGYLRNSVISSFAGVFPIDDPHYLVLIMLDDPHGDAAVHNLRYGAWTAAPVVREIIARSGPILGVPPSRPGADAAMQDELAQALGASARGTSKDRHVATVANAQ